MVVKLDPIAYKKLSLIKQMYQRAAILSNRKHSIIDKIIALIVFDLTVETALKVVVNSLDSSSMPDNSFQKLIDQAIGLLRKKKIMVPTTVYIKFVHLLRNDTQHKAKYPNESDLEECRVHVRDFLKTLVSNVYDTDFDTISQTNWIKNKTIKQKLTDAEKHLQSGDYKKTAELANEGLYAAVEYAGRLYVGSPMDLRFTKIAVEDDGVVREDKDITDALQRIQNTVRHLALGLNYYDQIKFNKIAGFVTSVYPFDNYSISKMKENIEKDEAEFVLSFAIDSIIQIENHVGGVFVYSDLRDDMRLDS